MTDTLANLRRKIAGSDKVKSVVRTMKAMAAASIGQYEAAARSLEDYERTVTLGLSACFQQTETMAASYISRPIPQSDSAPMGAIVFGSDQGLVGQFNDVMADFVIQTLSKFSGEKKVWVVGERLHARLADAGIPLVGLYDVPNSVTAITQLVGRIQIDCEADSTRGEHPYEYAHVHVFHNRPQSAAQYEPVYQRLLPLDTQWQQSIAATPWPTSSLPEAIGAENENQTLRALIREYLFISLFKACAESLASENASRLAAMQRAEKNIDALSTQLNRTFYRLRQGAIDEELFDVITGFNALKSEKPE